MKIEGSGGDPALLAQRSKHPLDIEDCAAFLWSHTADPYMGGLVKCLLCTSK